MKGAVLRPLLGVLLLLAVNAACDALASGGPGLFGHGSFLRLEWREGVVSGAMVDVLKHASATIVLAMGMALVIATRGVDLSAGSVMAVAGVVGGVLASRGAGSMGAMTGALGAGAFIGLGNGLLVTRVGLQPFVATLVSMVAGRGVAQLISDGQVVGVQDAAVVALGGGRLFGLPIQIVVAGVVVSLTTVAVRWSAMGLLIEAVGANPEAARLAGVRRTGIVTGVYVVSGLMAGLAGLMAAGDIKAADPFHSGVGAELSAIFAVVVGGTALTGGRFSLGGAVAGAVLLQTLTTTMYARNVSAEVAPLPQALVILAVCVGGSGVARRWVRWRRAEVRA